MAMATFVVMFSYGTSMTLHCMSALFWGRIALVVVVIDVVRVGDSPRVLVRAV
jgi:hypothetical protein